MDREHWQEPHCRNYGNKVKEWANKLLYDRAIWLVRKKINKVTVLNFSTNENVDFSASQTQLAVDWARMNENLT